MYESIHEGPEEDKRDNVAHEATKHKTDERLWKDRGNTTHWSCLWGEVNKKEGGRG